MKIIVAEFSAAVDYSQYQELEKDLPTMVQFLIILLNNVRDDARFIEYLLNELNSENLPFLFLELIPLISSFAIQKENIIEHDLLDKLIDTYGWFSKSFESAKQLTIMLLAFSDYFTLLQITRIAVIALHNDQIHGSYYAQSQLGRFFKKKIKSSCLIIQLKEVGFDL